MNDDLAPRVRALERQNRLLWLVLIGGTVIAWAACSRAPEEDAVLRTSSLEIVDGDGVAQAVFHTGEEGAVLMLGDAHGEVRAGFVVTDAGPGLALSDEQGHERLLLSASGGGGTGLYLYDSEGTGRLTLGMGSTRGTGLMLVDAAGTTRAGLGLDENRGPSMILADEGGGLIAAIP